jgi:hypothetical protein
LEGVARKLAAILGDVLVGILASCVDDSGRVEVTSIEAATALVPPSSTLIPSIITSGLTPCDEVDGTCLYLLFDGEGCTYVGPTLL